jgi:hypothetical protein
MIQMPITNYDTNPALRPTVLAKSVLENVYRPSREVPAVGQDATEMLVARTTPRAA